MSILGTLACNLGIHKFQGILHMHCGCGWNHCVRCRKPKSLEDRQVMKYHRKNHEP